MEVLIYIKKLDTIKKLDNISSNQIDTTRSMLRYINTIPYKEFIDLKKSYLIFYKNYNITYNLSRIMYKSYSANIFLQSYINIIIVSDTYILEFYKNYINSKVYSNYNISILYNFSIKDLARINCWKVSSDSYNISNILKPFKAGNAKLIKKISVIDLILKKYIESYLDSKVSLNFSRYCISFFSRRNIYLRVIRRRLRRMRRMLGLAKVSLRNFIRITLVFLITKDIDIFSKLLLQLMNSMHYKNHKRFLYYLKLFISKSMRYYFELLKFEGFFFYLSGKISGGGNSKKKRYAIRCGKYSLTNKMLKLKYKKGLIHTKTGVLGYKFMISYI